MTTTCERISDERLAELVAWYDRADAQHNGWWIAVDWALRELQEWRANCTGKHGSQSRCVSGDSPLPPETSERPILEGDCPTHGHYRINAAGCPACYYEQQRAHSAGLADICSRRWEGEHRIEQGIDCPIHGQGPVCSESVNASGVGFIQF